MGEVKMADNFILYLGITIIIVIGLCILTWYVFRNEKKIEWNDNDKTKIL